MPKKKPLSQKRANARISEALDVVRDGISDGDHHKMWFIDQMVRALTGCPLVEKTGIGSVSGVSYTYEVRGESPEYLAFVREYENGEDGPDTYTWEEGIAP